MLFLLSRAIPGEAVTPFQLLHPRLDHVPVLRIGVGLRVEALAAWRKLRELPAQELDVVILDRGREPQRLTPDEIDAGTGGSGHDRLQMDDIVREPRQDRTEGDSDPDPPL